jgi:formiminotetrahydrofolate cyclodeaminase
VVVRLCARGLQHAQTVAAYRTRAARSDVDLGIALLCAGVTGAYSNLETRLSRLTDVPYTETVVEEIARDSGEAATAAAVQTPPA